jgi:hypothetical protein
MMIMGRTAALSEQKAQTSKKDLPDWLASDSRWLLAQRVAASQAFVRSRFLSRFLLYVVAETVVGRASEISEHQIGVQVFDRPANYRSTEDNIVRTYARQLRRRLAEYFAGEGKAERLYIDVPLGGYVPVFVTASAPVAHQAGSGLADEVALSLPASGIDVHEAPLSSAQVRSRWRSPLLFLGAIAVYSVALVWISGVVEDKWRQRQLAAAFDESTAPLWTALFGGPANCYIVPADAGFNLIEDLSRHPLPLASYVNGSYLNAPLAQIDEQSARDLQGQHFTSFVDLQTVTALAGLPEFNAHRVILRFPRDLQLDDLKSSNAIILGSMSSNPWAAIAESNANFRIVNGASMHDASIVNLKPQPGEAPSYASQWSQPAHETYALIEFLPNLNGNGHLLLIEGLDVAGTQAAAEMLLHTSAISEVLSRAKRSDGSLRSFEVLLRSRSIASRSASAQIIGSRVY